MIKLRNEAGFTSWDDALAESELKLKDTTSFENRLKILYALIPLGKIGEQMAALHYAMVDLIVKSRSGYPSKSGCFWYSQGNPTAPYGPRTGMPGFGRAVVKTSKYGSFTLQGNWGGRDCSSSIADVVFTVLKANKKTNRGITWFATGGEPNELSSLGFKKRAGGPKEPGDILISDSHTAMLGPDGVHLTEFGGTEQQGQSGSTSMSYHTVMYYPK